MAMVIFVVQAYIKYKPHIVIWIRNEIMVEVISFRVFLDEYTFVIVMYFVSVFKTTCPVIVWSNKFEFQYLIVFDLKILTFILIQFAITLFHFTR